MRGLFVLLLLANMGFLGWQLWSEPKDNGPKPYGGVTALNGGLTLLSELNEEQQPPSRKLVSAKSSAAQGEAPVELIEPEPRARLEGQPLRSGAEQSAETGAPICYQSEILDDRDEANNLQRKLSKAGIGESSHKVVQTKRVNYWVMLKPYSARAKAEEAADMLKKRKVKDFFIVRSGEYENAVSLGVFSSRERAEQRYKSITGLKLRLRKPVIEAIELPAKRYVVTFRVADGAVADGLSTLLDDPEGPVLKKTPCN
jgi:hypothetical protein